MSLHVELSYAKQGVQAALFEYVLCECNVGHVPSEAIRHVNMKPSVLTRHHGLALLRKLTSRRMRKR